MSFKIGVDTGGTFTDVVILDENGNLTTGKSLTTPHNFSEGVGSSLVVASEKLGLTVERLLENTVAFAYGTTIGTNAIATRTGARVGMLTTVGCKDVIHISRGLSRWTGLPESETKHMAATLEPEPLVPKEIIWEVQERIDANGEIVCNLNHDDVKIGGNKLIEKGVKSIAVCFLWSFRNNKHEKEAQSILSELFGDTYITSSHEVIPLEGEYERFITTILDAYVGPLTVEYMMGLNDFLKEKGLKPKLLLMKADGAIAYSDEIRPVATVHSGPAAGVKAAQALGRILGCKNIISTDVGGTTFDVSVITDGKETFSREPRIEKYNTLYPTLDIISIGAGGGTIVSADEEMKTIHVGPRSAGSNPGPACYGFGGEHATITDAALLLGYVNPEYFVGGRMKLKMEEARKVFQKVARPLGIDIIEAAYGSYEIINSHMSDLIIGMTVRRGLNVSDYVLLSFGGAGPVHVAHMGATLGAKKAIIPSSSSVYSALGLASSPIGHTHIQYDYQILPIGAEVLNKNIGELHKKVKKELRDDGIKEENNDIHVYVDMKYLLQINAVRFEIPLKEEYTEEDAENLAQWFDAAYSDMYGEGSGYPEAGRCIVSYMVKGEGVIYNFEPRRAELGDQDPSHATKGQRDAFFKGDGFIPTNVYEFDKLNPGNKLGGPSVIEAEETTIIVPPGFSASLDGLKNVEIEQD